MQTQSPKEFIVRISLLEQHNPHCPSITKVPVCWGPWDYTLSWALPIVHGPGHSPSFSPLQHGPSNMLKAISVILPCNCLPDFKQADKNIHPVSYELTSEQPLPTQPPSTDQPADEEEEQAKDQKHGQEQEPGQKAVLLSPATEDDPDSTLTAIEASIKPNIEDEGEDQLDEEATKFDINSKRSSALPNLELNIPCDPLPDFSLNSRSRLSYWGPSPHLPPDQALPETPVRLHQPLEPRTSQSLYYDAYFRGEETLPRILLSMRSNPRLATFLRRA